jgi:hypothetical protein
MKGKKNQQRSLPPWGRLKRAPSLRLFVDPCLFCAAEHLIYVSRVRFYPVVGEAVKHVKGNEPSDNTAFTNADYQTMLKRTSSRLQHN